jgi:acylphosphatase
MSTNKERLKYRTPDGRNVVMVCFEGRVQMVSFRATCNQIATQLGLGGKVKNMENKDEVEAIFKGKWEVISICIAQLAEEFELTYTRVERLPINEWESEDPHWIDYGNGKRVYYTPITYYVPQGNTDKNNDLGLVGDDDFNTEQRLRDKLSKEDRDYIYGDGD